MIVTYGEHGGTQCVALLETVCLDLFEVRVLCGLICPNFTTVVNLDYRKDTIWLEISWLKKKKSKCARRFHLRAFLASK